MTAILDNFISFLTYWMIPSFIIGLVGLGFLLHVRWGNPTNKKKSLKIGITLFGQTFLTWIIMFATLWVLEGLARQELKKFLEQPDLTITVNGEITSKTKSDSIAKELIKIRNITAHHSSPKNRIILTITSQINTETIILAKDSEIENEYWIFWDKYKATTENEIGRIRTEIF